MNIYLALNNRMVEPLDLNRFIKLITSRELSKTNIQTWYACVKHNAASGIVTSVATVDDDGEQQDVRLVHRHTDAGHEYLVPLTRDLGKSEVNKIVEAFAELLPDRDFDIETNETRLVANDYGEIPLDAAKHVALCTALSKHQHEEWMHERSEAGWRYGTKYDAKEKTHPLLRTWDQLPERYRTPDMDWPQKLMKMLNAHGYSIIHKEELDQLLAPDPEIRLDK